MRLAAFRRHLARAVIQWIHRGKGSDADCRPERHQSTMDARGRATYHHRRQRDEERMTSTTTPAGATRAAGSSGASASTAPTQFVKTGLETYAYRRFGGGAAPPLVFLQHFTGTLDNWDPAVADPLARGREVILFESAGLGRSTGAVPTTVPGMTRHLLAFADALGLTGVD